MNVNFRKSVFLFLNIYPQWKAYASSTRMHFNPYTKYIVYIERVLFVGSRRENGDINIGNEKEENDIISTLGVTHTIISVVH